MHAGGGVSEGVVKERVEGTVKVLEGQGTDRLGLVGEVSTCGRQEGGPELGQERGKGC